MLFDWMLPVLAFTCRVSSPASRYYSTLPYFISKLLCDLLPIRVLPAILYCFITYGMVGLRGNVDSPHFAQYLVLVLLVNSVVRVVVLQAASDLFHGLLIVRDPLLSAPSLRRRALPLPLCSQPSAKPTSLPVCTSWFRWCVFRALCEIDPLRSLIESYLCAVVRRSAAEQ